MGQLDSDFTHANATNFAASDDLYRSVCTSSVTPGKIIFDLQFLSFTLAVRSFLLFLLFYFFYFFYFFFKGNRESEKQQSRYSKQWWWRWWRLGISNTWSAARCIDVKANEFWSWSWSDWTWCTGSVAIDAIGAEQSLENGWFRFSSGRRRWY